MRLLVTADTHIGCRSSHISADAASSFTPAGMLRERIVQAARDYAVDAVLLAGDIIDEQNKYFEALGVIEDTVDKLAHANIPMVAVAGNHDYDVLPRMAESKNATFFKVLGTGGNWTSVLVQGSDETVVQICGWSFPGENVRTSPLQTFSVQKDETASYIIGLMHADLDQSESPYGPVHSTELANTGVPFWVLGHIHKPIQQQSEGISILYPGSSQGLDPGPGEKGLHGPWLVDISGRHLAIEQLPLAPVRYETAEIQLENPEAPTDVREHVHRALRSCVKQWKSEGPDLESVSIRLVVKGTTSLSHSDLKSVLNEIAEAGSILIENVDVYLDHVETKTYPPIDLEAIKREQSPPGVLAELLDELNSDQSFSPEVEKLINDEQNRLSRDVYQANTFANLSDADESKRLTREEVIARLQKQASALLTVLWKQRNAAGDT